MPRKQLTEYVVERLRIDLSFPNPAYVSRKRFNQWAGNTPEKIECMLEQGDDILIPRGAVNILRKRCADRGLEIEFRDERSEGRPLPV